MLNAKQILIGRAAAVMRTGLLVALAAAVISGAGPARAETATAFMQRVANDLLAASRSGSAVAFATAFRSHADVPGIGLSALGSYASSLPKTQRPTYYNGMINWIARYAAKESPNYPVAKAVVVGASNEGTGGIYVDTTVTLKSGSSYDVRWLLVRRGSSFKVREAELMGYGMTTYLSTLFQNYIADEGRGDPRVLVMALNR